MSMFTREEALTLVRDRLKLAGAESRLSADRKSFLEEVVIAIQTQQLFQNLRLLSLPPDQRHKPTIEEIKADFQSGIGGLCYNLNVATYFLLQALGFTVTLAHATCTSSVHSPKNHIIVYVHDLCSPGDKYLIEVGFGFATYRVIDCNFEKESPVYIDSFIEYKYVKHEGHILRMHRKGDPIRAASLKKPNPVTDLFIDDFRRFYYAELEGTTDLNVFHEYMHKVWTDPKYSPFHLTFRVIGFPAKKAVMVVNQRLMVENEGGELDASEINGGDKEVVATVMKYFPELPEALVRDAMREYRATQAQV